VIYAPVACGITAVPCLFECVIERECGHKSDHNCHEGECPGCTAVGYVECVGHGSIIKGVCSKGYGICGKPCGRQIGCARLVLAIYVLEAIRVRYFVIQANAGKKRIDAG
jgi:hypothetical protein